MAKKFLIISRMLVTLETSEEFSDGYQWELCKKGESPDFEFLGDHFHSRIHNDMLCFKTFCAHFKYKAEGAEERYEIEPVEDLGDFPYALSLAVGTEIIPLSIQDEKSKKSKKKTKKNLN